MLALLAYLDKSFVPFFSVFRPSPVLRGMGLILKTENVSYFERFTRYTHAGIQSVRKTRLHWLLAQLVIFTIFSQRFFILAVS